MSQRRWATPVLVVATVCAAISAVLQFDDGWTGRLMSLAALTVLSTLSIAAIRRSPPASLTKHPTS